MTKKTLIDQLRDVDDDAKIFVRLADSSVVRSNVSAQIVGDEIPDDQAAVGVREGDVLIPVAVSV